MLYSADIRAEQSKVSLGGMGRVCDDLRMPARKDLDTWYEEQVRLDPSFKASTDALLAGSVPRRKLSLLCDECLEAEFVEWLRGESQLFKVFTLPKRRSDDHLWQDARTKRRLIVTSDRDFLDDNRYPLHESPGVLYVEAPTIDRKIDAFVRFFVAGSFLDLFSRMEWAVFQGTKSSVSPGHGEYRTHNPDDGSVLVSTLWSAPLQWATPYSEQPRVLARRYPSGR